MSDIPWPNQEEIIDGVVPVAEVPQDPDLFDNDSDDDPDAVMED